MASVSTPCTSISLDPGSGARMCRGIIVGTTPFQVLKLERNPLGTGKGVDLTPFHGCGCSGEVRGGVVPGPWTPIWALVLISVLTGEKPSQGHACCQRSESFAKY